MASILQASFSNLFSYMEIVVGISINSDSDIGTEQGISHYMN